MQAYRIETSLTARGALTLKKLPFENRARVEVIVLERKTPPASKKALEKYPLRGKPIRYTDLVSPTFETEWEVNQ